MVSSALTLDDSIAKYKSPSRTASSLGAGGASSAKLTTIVIEIGTRLTRVGWAEESAPHEVFRTQFVHPLRPWASLPLYDADRDPEEQNQIFCTFFKEVFMRKQLKHPASCRVVFVENPFSTDKYRNAIVRAMTEHPSLLPVSISFVHTPLMHTIACNVQTALVIDTGIEEIQLYPVVDELLMITDFAATSCSTKTVEKQVEELMLEYGHVVEFDGQKRRLTAEDLGLFKRLGCAEDICFRFCFATTRERGLKLQEFFQDNSAQIEDPPPPVKISFGTEMLMVPGIVREGAAESVFTHNQDIPSIPQLVTNFIDLAPIDLKRTYAENLRFVGGLSQMSGFLSRVRTELLFLFENDYDRRLAAISSVKFHRLKEAPTQSLYSAWLGASISRNFDQTPSTVPNSGLYY